MTALRTYLSLLLAAFLLGGCFTIQILPLTTEMEDIHDTYRREFSARYLVPGPGTATGDGQQQSQASLQGFTHTIEKIRAFQLRHPDRKTENAHLTVLEGMIYLQLGKLASAKLMESDVTESGSALGTSDAYAPRDRLFSQNFSTMIALAGLKSRYDEIAKGTDVAAYSQFETAAKDSGAAICTALTAYPGAQTAVPICGTATAEGPQATAMAAAAGAAGDGGPLYLAANAAIAYAWAYKGAEGICNESSPTPAQLQACLDNGKARYLVPASNLVLLFMTPTEQKLAKAEDTVIVTPDSGRARYIRLVQQLEKCMTTEGCDLSGS